jgi:hypothetical protein
MNFLSWIANKVNSGQEASISLALLERNIPDEVPSLRVIEDWASGVCRELGCTSTIHLASDVVTFYPVTKL